MPDESASSAWRTVRREEEDHLVTTSSDSLAPRDAQQAVFPQSLDGADEEAHHVATRACRRGSKMILEKRVRHYPIRDSKNLVEPHSAGTNTIGIAGLAAVAAALTEGCTHIATESLSSLRQLSKRILYPEKQGDNVQGDNWRKVSNLARTSQSHTSGAQLEAS
eukprot:1147649-Pelagomonas_calceolata.AAC.2